MSWDLLFLPLNCFCHCFVLFWNDVCLHCIWCITVSWTPFRLMTSLWLLQVNFVGSLEWIHQLSGALPVIRNVFTDNFFYNLYKFCQHCKIGKISPKSQHLPNSPFSPICQHFGVVLPGLIYSLLSFRQQPLRLAKFCLSRHFRKIHRFRQHYGAPLTGFIYSL